MTGQTASLANDDLHRRAGGAARWRHRLALATAVATFVLLLIGGGVTSSDVGMADPVWPTPPWYLLVVSSLQRGLGFVIEHGHRAWGYVVGLLTMVLCGWMWLGERRRVLRWLATAALLGVIAQGVLGGLRVLLNVQAGRELALLHGCVAQAFFALVCSIALLSSPRWTAVLPKQFDGIAALRRLGIVTCTLVYLQLILGAALRHLGFGLTLHLLVALAVVAHGILLARRVAILHAPPQTGTRRWAAFLITLLVIQVALGAATWATSNGFGVSAFEAASAAQILLATAHVGVGALVLAGTLVLTLKLFRHWEPASQVAALPLRAAAEVTA